MEMTQTSNRLFDEMARLMGDAASVAQGVKREAETLFRTQMHGFCAGLELVKRVEFDIAGEMASQAHEENTAPKESAASDSPETMTCSRCGSLAFSGSTIASSGTETTTARARLSASRYS